MTTSTVTRTIHDTKNQIIDLYREKSKEYNNSWGFCSLNKAGCIIDYVDDICKNVENPVCVEVGVFGGMSVFPAALELKRHGKGIIHAIDPWSNEEATIDYHGQDKNYWSTVDLERYYNIFLTVIEETETSEYINVIRSTSDDAPEFPDVDYAYIDGQHTVQAYRDVDKYAKRVKVGGYCILDDVNWGVEKGIPHYLETLGFRRIHIVDAAMVFKRVSMESLRPPMTFDWVDDSKFDYIMNPREFDWALLDWDNVYQIQREIYTEKVYRWFRDVQEGDVVVDLGASCGPFTHSILAQKPSKVICVEPNKTSVEAIHKNCDALAEENGVDLVVVNHALLSDGQDKTGMITDKDFTSQTFLEFLIDNNLKKIDFLKMDIEGGEYEVFSEENINYLANKVEFISMELHLRGPNFREKFKAFRDKHLNKFGSYKLISDAVNYENKHFDFTHKIFDDHFIDNYQRELMLYLDNGNNINPEPISTFEPIGVLNSTPQKSVWIVDGFYKDPDSVRSFALKQDYHTGGIGRGYIGNRTHQQFLFPGLKERFEEIMGKKITKWQEHGMNGRFQWCISGQPQVWHCDQQMWGGMLYLTPGAPFQYGTTLYAQRYTKARSYRQTGWNASWEGIPGDPHLDGSDFEPVDVLGNVYNRLVIFDAACIHSSSGYFGTVKENCRLWQMFFFDTED